MTSSNTFKRFVSVGAALLLAIGGSLVATQPAMASNVRPTVTSSTSPSNYSTSTYTDTGATSWDSVDIAAGAGGSTTASWVLCKDNFLSSFNQSATQEFPPTSNISGAESHDCRYPATSGISTASIDSFDTALTIDLSLVTHLVSKDGTSIVTTSAHPLTTEYSYLLRVVEKRSASNTLVRWLRSDVLTLTGPRFTATLDANGGTLGTVTSVLADSIGNASLPNSGSPSAAPSRAGYNLGGWSTNQSATQGSYQVTLTTNTTYFAVWVTSNQNNNQIPQSYTMTSAPSYSIANGVATANVGTWSGGTPVLWWIICDTAITTPVTGFPPMDCGPIYTTGNANTMERNLTFTLTTDVWATGQGQNNHTQVSLSSKYLGLYVSNGGNNYVTPTTAVPASVSVVSAPVLTPEQARNQIKPLPVIVQPLVAALPQLSKPMFNQGGKLALTSGDFSGLVSASISGKPLDLSVASNGGLTITVPNGEAGKTADLFLKFTTGTVIIQDAIKYVAPVIVADVPVRPISIAAGSTKLTESNADEVRQAAFANVANTSVSCIAYATNGSAAAKNAARSIAKQACALATKANPSLTAAPVTVVVDKAKAKTAAVGIKVYKATN